MYAGSNQESAEAFRSDETTKCKYQLQQMETPTTELHRPLVILLLLVR